MLFYEISGLNLERLLRAAAQGGLSLRRVRRVDERTMSAGVRACDRAALLSLCARCGWQARETRAGILVRAARFLRRRRLLGAGALLGAALLFLSSQTVLAVRVTGAGAHSAEVLRALSRAGARPGRPKRALPAGELQDALALALPGLSFAGVRYAGSTLLVECESSRAGENLSVPGGALDLVAAEAGIVTRLWVEAGTPLVKPGQAVRAGQTLVRGEERAGGGETRRVRAQGQVSARVFARGDARVSLVKAVTRETGRTRTRVTLCAPFYSRVVADAAPFPSQDESAETQPVVGLFLPVYRRVETFAETEVENVPRDEDEAKRIAQGAAERAAKIKCAPGAQILDKWTEYSKINEEFVQATVILEYERDIASRGE